MKICIPTMGDKPESGISVRFGRTPYFLVYDTETKEWEATVNGSAQQPGGAGISTAQTITTLKAGVLVAPNCGPNAYNVLAEAGIKVYTCGDVSVVDALAEFQAGNLTEMAGPNVESHH